MCNGRSLLLLNKVAFTDNYDAGRTNNSCYILQTSPPLKTRIGCCPYSGFWLSVLQLSRLKYAGYTMTFWSGKCFISDDANSTASISANCLRDRYILELQYTLTSKSSENDSSINATTIASDTTTALQSKAKTFFHKKRKKQLQAHKMTADLTPAPTIAARLWHRRLALLHPVAMSFLIDVLNNLDNAMCNVCLQAMHKLKCIRTKVKRATAPFRIVHSDTCSPIAVPTKRSHHQYIILVDDYIWWTTVYYLYHKKKATCIAAY